MLVLLNSYLTSFYGICNYIFVIDVRISFGILLIKMWLKEYPCPIVESTINQYTMGWNRSFFSCTSIFTIFFLWNFTHKNWRMNAHWLKIESIWTHCWMANRSVLKQIIHVNVSYSFFPNFHRYILDTMAAVSTSCPSSKDTVLALLSREVRFDNVQSQRLKRKQRALGSPKHSGAF